MLVNDFRLKFIVLSTVAIVNPVFAATPMTATAGLESISGSKVSGTLKFSQENGKVHIEGTINGLKPNHSHGMHIHQNGACSGKDAKDAGDHFTVAKKPHGSPTDKTKHEGDLGNILANDKGIATVDIFTEDFSLDSKNNRSVLNRSIIVHEKEDDLKTQPSGNSGGRIGCGIIKM